MCTRTNALGPVVCNRPSKVARRTFSRPVYSATRTGLRHAMLACTRIDYKRTSRFAARLQCMTVCSDLQGMCTRTNTLGAVMTERPPGVAQRAFFGTDRRTTGSSLTHAIIACADIHCKIA